MDITEPVCVCTETDATRAEMIKGFLRSEGISCFLAGEQTSANLGLSAFSVDIMVPAGHADRAQKLLERHDRQHCAR